MKTTITAKNMNVSNGVNERIMKKTGKMERYFSPDTEMIVRLTKEKNNRRKCEITVPFEGVVLRAEAATEDNLYVSIDQALAKLERQGAKLVVLIPMIMAALNLVYPLLASMVTGLSMGDLMDSSVIGSIVGGVALSIYNKKYYEERDSILID